MKSRLTRCVLAGFLSLASVSTAGSGPPPGVAAEVDGAAITEEEVDGALGAPLRKLERQIYELRRQQIEAAINDRLLAREAAQRGMTVQTLLEVEVISKTAPVMDQEVEAAYAANKARPAGIRPEEINARIRAHLQTQRTAERRKAFLEALRSRAQVVVYLVEPPVFRVDISTGGAPFIGAADAPVTIVEFSDFQCPYCKRVLPTLAELRSRYGAKIKLVFRDFPLDSIHPLARRAAEAARCANDQGKFWDYHDILFRNAPNANPHQLKEYAEKVGLDGTNFEQCLARGTHAAGVQKDLDEGLRLGVTGTPAFFINGQFLSGAQPLERFVRLIDEELKRIEISGNGLREGKVTPAR